MSIVLDPVTLFNMIPRVRRVPARLDLLVANVKGSCCPVLADVTIGAPAGCSGTRLFLDRGFPVD